MNKTWRIIITTLIFTVFALFFASVDVTGYEIHHVYLDTVEKALVSDELYFTLDVNNYNFSNNTSFLVGALTTSPNTSLLIYLYNNSTISAE